MRARSLCLIIVSAFALTVRSQSVLSGIINQYAAVTAIDTCRNGVAVAAATGFRAGGQALLIQMQGASIDTDNSPDFGNVTDLGGAGRYEKVIISSVTGNFITFQNEILNDYDVNGALQLVSMPVYNEAIVRSPLMAKPWDGATGGVIALDVRGTLTLEANIDASGVGFRGGKANIQGDTECNFTTSVRDFGRPLGDWRGAAKGEGIARWLTGLEAGRGPQANGGGGGNDHNSGGGGGANVTAGGRGGRNDEPSLFGCSGSFPGDGGNAVVADTSRLYLGGGGGAGDENNDVGTDGGNGGGMVFVLAKTLNANGFTIRANGTDAAKTAGDGAGGGGAGGTILLQGQTLSGSLTVEAKGGKGGDIDNRNQQRCHGPGGGGSGGRYLGPSSWSPTVNLNGGAAGVSFNSAAAACGNAENLAGAGIQGIQQRKTGLPEGKAPLPAPKIENVSSSPTACEGGAWQALAVVEGRNLTLQWQVQNGNAYVDLSATSPYTGVNSTQLRIDPTTPNLHGARYRLKVVTSCGETLFSDPVILEVGGLPKAGFSLSQNELEVTFTNQSTGASGYTWFFGDGAQSTEVNPVHQYRGNGDYEVILVARNACGADTLRQALNINVGRAPLAAFSYGPLTGCAPLKIQFVNESQGDYTQLEWRFLGGSPAVSTEQNPVVTFTESGLYTFGLLVSGPLGQDLQTVEAQIEILPPPVADFTFITSGRTVTFQNNSTGAGTYRWLFGDGTEETTAEPVHSYGSAGDYDVTLIIGNDCGADTARLSVGVGLAPEAAFSFSPSSACSPLRVQFANQSAGDFTEVLWRFPGGDPATSSEINPEVTYTQTGAYTFSLLLAGPWGEDSLLLSANLEVLTPPVADFSFTTDGRIAYFQNNSGRADSYTWDFGDGEEDTAVNPKHTYENLGSYEVTLIAANACGQDTVRSVIVVGSAPVARYAFEPAGGCTPAQIRFSDQSTGDLSRLKWEFPGGEPDSSTDPEPLIRYATPGLYGFRLYVEGPLGTDQIEVAEAVEILPIPEPAFSYELRGDTLRLQNLSANARSYRWNFGDGVSSREENPVHVFGQSGTFDVTLNASNPYCGKSTAKRIRVTITSTEEALRAAGITLYPNPMTDLLYLDISNRGLLPLQVSLLNSVGQELEQWEVAASQAFSLAGHPAGLYYVLISSEQGAWVGRVVKQ